MRAGASILRLKMRERCARPFHSFWSVSGLLPRSLGGLFFEKQRNTGTDGRKDLRFLRQRLFAKRFETEKANTPRGMEKLPQKRCTDETA